MGSVDFGEIGKLCKRMLNGETGGAISTAEKMLAEGKSVGNLVKDVLHFLNALAVAKTCRDAEKILALSKDSFALVQETANGTDGHGILRALEIFATVENEMKYSITPKIIFETAVLKTAMPREDYDIESLISRISALEEKLQSGAPVQAVERTQEEKGKERELPPPPPMEEPPFLDDAPMEVEELPPQRVAEEPSKKEIKVPVGDAKAVFGGFLRSLRKTGKNGVLFTICMDLESAFVDGVFTLFTTSDTIYRSLQKEDHYSLVKEAFRLIGIEQFAIEKKEKEGDQFDKAIKQLKEDFPNTNIQIK